MNARIPPPPRCENEGCVRPAEPGDRYCSACCLERLLYDREERIRSVEAAPRRAPQERRA